MTTTPTVDPTAPADAAASATAPVDRSEIAAAVDEAGYTLVP